MLPYVTMTLLMLCGLLLWVIILLQRGRGGGLAGAFGGLGGQSAFGTKAGDVFTKITIVLTLVWVILAGVNGLALQSQSSRRFKSSAPANPEIEEPPGAKKDEASLPELPSPDQPTKSENADKKGGGSDTAPAKGSAADTSPKPGTTAPAETPAPDAKKEGGAKPPADPDSGKSPSK